MPRYPTDGLRLIPGWVMVSARGSAQDQGVWQGSPGLLFLPLPFSPPPRSNSPGLSINCHRGSRGFQEVFDRISADLKRDFRGMGGKYPRALLESLKDSAVLSEALHRKLQNSKPRGPDLASTRRMLWCPGSREPHCPVMD